MSAPFCQCAGSAREGWTRDPDRDLWVCALCLRPSRATYEKETE